MGQTEQILLELEELDDYIDVHLVGMVKELQEMTDTSILPHGHVRMAARIIVTLPVASLQFVKDMVTRKALERLLVYQTELEKCSAQADYIAQLNPQHVEVWNGAISERIRAGVEIMYYQRELR